MMLLPNRESYLGLFQHLHANSESPEQVDSALRQLCLDDLYYLLRYELGREDFENDFLFARCREVQASPDDHLDLWAREFYKSTIITYGLTIQNILNNPNITVGIFSHTRPIAKAFLRQIKREFESNDRLKAHFPEILWTNPSQEAPKWSEDDGLIVKRDQNSKESTVEAHGVVDGQPTGKHFSLLVYDDIVTLQSVGSPEMIEKTNDALSISFNLGADGGKRRFIGTRYHYNDSYRMVLERDIANPRIYAAEDDDGNPVFLPAEKLAKKRKDMGPYVYSCFVGETKILMSNGKQKAISNIVVGEEVFGYTFPDKKNARVGVARSKVVAIQSNKKAVARFTFASGREIICTPDHKFYTGRRGVELGGKGSHKTYLPISKTQQAISLYDPRHINKAHNELSAAWLAGFFDGEGSVSANTIVISQSPEHNPDVCEKLESVLTELGFDYGTHEREGGTFNGCHHKAGRTYYIRGGLQEKLRFLTCVNPVRGYKIIETIFNYPTRFLGKMGKDKVVRVEHLGERTVYNIQTETGNYIAEGYAVKNCQMLQAPVGDASQGFKRDWLRFFDGNPPPDCNWYILVDPANGKRKLNDYTSMWAVGLGVDTNYYCIPEVRDKLNLTERAKRLMDLHRKYQPKEVRYESYGIQADIDYIKLVQEREHYRFDIIAVGGSMQKTDRIKRLIPTFENSKAYLPRKYNVTDHQGISRDLVKDFVEDEYAAFPVPIHDDMLDCLSRIADVEGKYTYQDSKQEISLNWPKPSLAHRPRKESRDWRL